MEKERILASAAEFSQQVVRGQRPGRKGYPISFRLQVAECVRQLREEKVSWAICSASIGISAVTLKRWLHQSEIPKQVQPPTCLIPVRVFPSEKTQASQTLSLETSCGLKVLGLSLPQTIKLIEALR